MIDFYIGEEKYVTATVKPKRNLDVIVVTEATYELKNKFDKIVDSGNCEIDGRVLTMLLNPPSVGIYTLAVYARIGAERIIETCGINVRSVKV